MNDTQKIKADIRAGKKAVHDILNSAHKITYIDTDVVIVKINKK